MNRTKFIESQGATCDNWTWSWSFVNHSEKIVIFGAWDIHTDGLIFDEDWKTTSGRKPATFNQSREHLRLIEEEGYTLKTFPMKYDNVNDDGTGRARIKSFTPKLEEKYLKRVGRKWYATDSKTSTQVYRFVQ